MYAVQLVYKMLFVSTAEYKQKLLKSTIYAFFIIVFSITILISLIILSLLPVQTTIHPELSEFCSLFLPNTKLRKLHQALISYLLTAILVSYMSCIIVVVRLSWYQRGLKKHLFNPESVVFNAPKNNNVICVNFMTGM